MPDENIAAPAELSLLDVAVVITENWMLLLAAPLLAGLLSFGVFSFASPKTFDSVSFLRLSATEAAVLPSAKILTPAITGTAYLGSFDGAFSRALHHLTEEALTVQREGETDVYSVRVQTKSAAESQELLSRIVNSLIANSTPTPTEQALLAIRIEQTKRSIAELERNLARLSRQTELTANDVVGNLGETAVALLTGIEERHTRLFQLEHSLQGSISSEDIIQPATLPDSPNAGSAAIRAMFVGALAALAAFVFAFIAAGWKGASRSADGLHKITRIRRAVGLPAKS
ncbi:MAG: hypothetical protein EOP22_10765 [Hyphomicrobiales bacterium]|nr:MAG: hypothetical protein EOP22_10765 [Hyphomicrobiales bacterium]